MKLTTDCEACLWRQAQEAIELISPGPELREEFLRSILQEMAEMNWELTPPKLAQRMHRSIRRLTSTPDPYKALKERLNERATALYPVWHRRFRQRFEPLEAAVRMAIAGNLLDAGPVHNLGSDAVVNGFQEALSRPLLGSVEELGIAITKARNILYLADNAGEIVFDRDLLAQLPLSRFALVVRGAPVLNDATMVDALWAGLENFCEILSNGSDAPGTLIEDCAPSFRQRFAEADLILAKGQGNYESLAGTDKQIFFLLKVKCQVLARSLGCEIGTFVLRHQKASARDVSIRTPVS